MFFCEVPPETVLKIFNKFKSTSNVDVYDISINIVKKCIKYIICLLTFFVKKCLMEGIFSNVLKLSTVEPVFEKMKENCPASHHLISLVTVFSFLILESIIYSKVSHYLQHKKIIRELEFGFQGGGVNYWPYRLLS